jgi:hypothetical protein
MTGERAARRYPALSFPEIRAVRLAPIGAAATLVNLSATGILVECASRAVPGSPMTVQFEGTFTPASIDSRVVRCEVSGIAADGSLRFRIGLVFTTRIAIPVKADDALVASPVVDSAPPPAAAPPPLPAPVPHNRW